MRTFGRLSAREGERSAVRNRDSYREHGDMRDSGYGVRDSYLRQSRYGRSDAYVDQVPEMGDYDRYDDAYDDAYDPRRAGQRIERGAPASYEDPYDWDDYTMRERAPREDPDALYRETDRRERPEKRVSSRRRRDGGRRRKGKGSFFGKIILLILAAAALLFAWRFSRLNRTSLGELIQNSGAVTGTGFHNFVIYGVDSREGNLVKDAHSDMIVICSMNEAAKTVRMVSVYRDTYLDNTNGEFRKATECYFFGGPERSINMLNKNLDLDLEDYITVDFNAVIHAVDLIGGVDIEVTEEELPYINGYQTENSQVTGAEITPVEYAGYQTLNGIQALAYCRIRYTAGYDFKRTERQRDVLTQIFQKAKQQGVTKMVQIMDALLPQISTSFSTTEMVSLASAMPDYTLGESTGFPFEETTANISAGDCVVPINLAQNVSELHAFLFGQEGYNPSDTVRGISDQISSDTGIY